MAELFFLSVPFCKSDVIAALESGVDGLIVPDADVPEASALSRNPVLAHSQIRFVQLNCKANEEEAAALARAGEPVVIRPDWEVIPMENLVAVASDIGVWAESVERALLAAGILERGVGRIIFDHNSGSAAEITARLREGVGAITLDTAVVTAIRPCGLGHRVCVDTTSLLGEGQGLLVGNSSGLTFLVHAETRPNEYVSARPFRINAGGVHAYLLMPNDNTAYLCELVAGREVLIADHLGRCGAATVGRVKIEKRPMLLIEAEVRGGEDKPPLRGSVFLQNAETVCLTSPGGLPVSVVELKPGMEILCKVDQAGRHFGMRVTEDIREE